jgi:hypothetical protein
MIKFEKTLLLALLFVTLALAQKTVTVSCSSSCSQCASKICLTMTGDGINETGCVSGTCANFATPVNVTLNNCTYDYSSTACSTGICFSIPNKQIKLAQTSTCVAQTRSYSCSNCFSTIGCAAGLCLTRTLNGGLPGGQECCLDAQHHQQTHSLLPPAHRIISELKLAAVCRSRQILPQSAQPKTICSAVQPYYRDG